MKEFCVSYFVQMTHLLASFLFASLLMMTTGAVAQEKAEPPAAAAAEPEEEKDPFDRHDYGDVEVTGRVVDPDGKPVAGATVFLRKYGVRVPSKKATTDEDGEFSFVTFRRIGPPRGEDEPDKITEIQNLGGGAVAKITRDNPRSKDSDEVKHVKVWIVATAPGYGFGTLAPGDDVTIRLVPDESITGRLTDTEGKPVAGAKVRVRDVFWPRRADDPLIKLEDRRGEKPLPSIPPGEGLDPWVGAVSRAVNSSEFHVARTYLIGFLDIGILGNKPSVYAPLIPPVTSDADGRFTLAGIGRERVAQLYVDGVADKASTLIVVANRTIEKPIFVSDESPETRQKYGWRDSGITVYGNKIDLTLQPGRTIQGVVTDKETGQPLEGMDIIGPTVTRLEYPGFDRFFTSSDKEGRFRIDSFPVMNQARFKLEMGDRHENRHPNSPAREIPYFGREIVADIKPGADPQQLDFPLAKGVWITGKVVDDETGKGIAHETIEYHVFNDNPFLKKDLAQGLVPDFDDNLRTNQDGSYRLRAYRGRGIVTGGAGHDYMEGVGAAAIPGLKKNEVFRSLYATKGFSPYIRNTTVEVNIADDAESHSVEIRLKKGRSRQVRVVGPDGNPQNQLQASGLENQIENPMHEVKQAFFKVSNLTPGENRKVVARHVPKKLIGMAVVPFKGQGPTTLTLQPWANLTGRLVDDAGQPLSKGLRIELQDYNLPIHTMNGQNYDIEEFLIDEDGKFHIDGLVPGAKYRLRVVKDGFVYLGDATEDFTLDPGETKEFGDVKVIEKKKKEKQE